MRNVLAWLVCSAVVLSLCGCRGRSPSDVYKPPVEGSSKPAPQDPDQALAEQLRSGTVQMAAASDSIQDALKEAKRAVASLKGDLKDAAQEVVDYIDDAGATVADACADPPALDDVKKDFAAADDVRKHRIAAGNDAYTGLQEAAGSVSDLQDQVEGLSTLSDLLKIAISDVSDAIQAYGGTVQSDDDVPVKDKESEH